MNRNAYLFSERDWFRVSEHRAKEMADEVGAFDGNRLLNTSVDDLCAYFEEKYQIDPPVLKRDQIVAKQQEVKIDVSQDHNRHIRDRSRPVYMDGTAIDITVPFAGDHEVFSIRPSTSTMNPPGAIVGNQVLTLRIGGTDLKADAVRNEIEGTLQNIEQYLNWIRKDVAGYNSQLRTTAKDHIERRRAKLLADQQLVASLGFNVVERGNSPLTFSAPEIRRKLPVPPPASGKPYSPEPILPMEEYDYILRVLNNMTEVMERSPAAFKTMDEEDLRTHFLVQLNGHYEGQATGETFNYEGKTDIRVRVQGKSIFIAECKVWGGPQKFAETLNQIMGYCCWRDTKVAILIFNRNKDFSKVLQSINQATQDHPQFKRKVRTISESQELFLFAHRDDRNREMFVATMAFDIPR